MGAIFALIVFSPIILIIAILIKIDNPQHPMFFKQVRVGKNETPFQMYKFRSMIIDAEGS